MQRTPDSGSTGGTGDGSPSSAGDASNPWAIGPPTSSTGKPPHREPSVAADLQSPPAPDYNTGQIARGLAALETKSSFHPDWVGQFRILTVLGEGGMGVVYEAEQQRPRRIIALKVIRPQIVTKLMLKRFDLEVAALARLQHPGIAHVYEAGANETPIGVQPYLVMELVRGSSLNTYVEQAKLDSRGRLELMAKVCDAVQYAHQRGVIHRDLKPGNILVDETGQPKILDFGVAKLAADPRDGDTPIPSLQTEAGNLVGTLQYMSPEQASGLSGDVDTRSDIYALGLICYELLAGRRPYDLSRRMLPDAVRMIREDDPAPLSSVSRTFRGDVETIIAKALAKEKDRRYASAGALAADIRRYLRDEPIAARPPSAAYQLAKFARRNKTFVAAAGATLLVLILGVISTSWQAMEAKQRAYEAAEGRKEADALRAAAERSARASAAQAAELRLLVGERALQDAWSKVDSGDSWTGLLLITRAMQLGPQDVQWQNDRRIAIKSILDRAPRLTGQAVLQEPSPPGPADDRYFAFRSTMSRDQKLAATWGGDTIVRLWDLHNGKLLRAMDHAGRVNFATFNEKADLLLTCSADGYGRVWKIGAGEEAAKPILLQHSANVRRGAFNRSGTRVATASADRSAKLWDPQTGRGTILSGHNAEVDHVVFSDTGDLVATASRNGTTRVWDATTGEPKGAFMIGGGQIGAIAFDLAAKHVLVGYEDGAARLWDIESGNPIVEVRHPRGVTALAFSPDASRFATGSANGAVQVWDAVTGRATGDRRQQNWVITRLAFDRGGDRLLITAGDDAATIAHVRQDEELDLVLSHGEGVNTAAFNEDANGVTSIGWDRTVRRWALPPLAKNVPGASGSTIATQPATLPTTLVPTAADAAAGLAAPPFASSSDGRYVATANRAGDVTVFDTRRGGEGTVIARHAAPVTHLAFSGGGQRLLSASAAGVVEVCDCFPGVEPVSPPRTLDHNRSLIQARINRQGSIVGTVTTDFAARLWDARSGQRLASLPAESGTRSLAFSPTSLQVAAVSTDGTVRMFDAQSGKPGITLGGASGVTDAWFDPTGRQIATAARDGTVRTWRSDTGAPVSPPLRHPMEIYSISFSADASRMLVACYNGPSRVWETATWRPLTRPIPWATVYEGIISPDGRRALLPDADRSTRVWEVEVDQPLIMPIRQHERISGAGFGEGGEKVCVVSARGALQMWNLTPDPRPLPDLQALAELLAARKLDGTGAITRLSVQEVQERWTNLSKRYPEQFAALPTSSTPKEPRTK